MNISLTVLIINLTEISPVFAYFSFYDNYVNIFNYNGLLSSIISFHNQIMDNPNYSPIINFDFYHACPQKTTFTVNFILRTKPAFAELGDIYNTPGEILDFFSIHYFQTYQFNGQNGFLVYNGEYWIDTYPSYAPRVSTRSYRFIPFSRFADYLNYYKNLHDSEYNDYYDVIDITYHYRDYCSNQSEPSKVESCPKVNVTGSYSGSILISPSCDSFEFPVSSPPSPGTVVDVCPKINLTGYVRPRRRVSISSACSQVSY